MRVRFAPSPTGHLHVGGARTALYNWILARSQKGSFILRIEDTDRSRSTEEAIQAIIEDLTWLGLDWDEGPGVGGKYGPYRQTERSNLYSKAALPLLDQGKAYRCFCTPEEIAQLKEHARTGGKPAKLNHRCRNLARDEAAALEGEGKRWALRFSVPDGKTVVEDLIRGEVVFDNDSIEDFVLLRRDGTATYNLAVVIDDLEMKISHVVRGDDHLPNTPKQLILYDALKRRPPHFAHLSMIVGVDGKPLSKRHGDVSVGSYRDHGYLPDALINFLALLGWSLDDKTTIMDRKTVIDNFSLERVTSKPAVWDKEKLEWMNGVFIRDTIDKELAGLIRPFLERAGYAIVESLLMQAVPQIKERMKVLPDAVPLLKFLKPGDIKPDEDSKELLEGEETRRILGRALAVLAEVDPFEEGRIEEVLREVAEELEVKPKIAFQPIRVAITGSKVSPPLFNSIALLGRERTLRRISDALNR